MDLSKFTIGDRIVVVSGFLLFIFGFFRWFGITVSAGNVAGFSGYHYFFFGVIPILLGAAMVAQVLVSRLSTAKMPSVGSLTWGQVHLIAGGIAALLVLIKVIAGSSYFSVHLDRKIGVFLALIAAIGLAAGGFFKMKEADTVGGSSSGPTV